MPFFSSCDITGGLMGVSWRLCRMSNDYAMIENLVKTCIGVGSGHAGEVDGVAGVDNPRSCSGEALTSAANHSTPATGCREGRTVCVRGVVIMDERFVNGRFSIDFPMVSGHDSRHAIGGYFLMPTVSCRREGTFDGSYAFPPLSPPRAPPRPTVRPSGIMSWRAPRLVCAFA